MNLTVRMLSIVSSSTSSNPERTSYGYQDPGKSVAGDDRSGKPEKTFWDMMQKVDPHREEPLLGRNAHSARYGELIHDGSGKPETLNHQEEANSENFVMGSDAAEFCEQSLRQSAKKTEKNVEHCRELYRTFNNMVNVYGYNIECGDINGKEFLNYLTCCQES